MKRNRRASRALASLFSGAGGLDLGFAEEGFVAEFAADTNASARDTFARNLGSLPEAGDLRLLEATDIPNCDVLIAGPPCQGFSSFRRLGGNDARNGLFIKTAAIIAAVRPKLFVVENVRGILNHAGGRFVSWAIHILEEAGLVVQPFVIDCTDFGVPQRRRRVVLVGGIPRYGRRAIQEFDSIWQREKRVHKATVGGALTDMAKPSVNRLANHITRSDAPAWYRDVIAHIGPGQKLCDTRRGATAIHSWEIPEVFGAVSERERMVLEELSRIRRHSTGRRYEHLGDGRAVTLRQLSAETALPIERLGRVVGSLNAKGYVQRTGGYVDLARKFNGRFKRLSPNQPAPAVTADFGSSRTVLHPTEDRGLTVRECARLQGFPDSFVFEGPVAAQYRLVANAVPPPVSRALARAVKSALAG